MNRPKPGIVAWVACLAVSLLVSACAAKPDTPAASTRPAKPALAAPPASLMTPQGY